MSTGGSCQEKCGFIASGRPEWGLLLQPGVSGPQASKEGVSSAEVIKVCSGYDCPVVPPAEPQVSSQLIRIKPQHLEQKKNHETEAQSQTVRVRRDDPAL